MKPAGFHLILLLMLSISVNGQDRRFGKPKVVAAEKIRKINPLFQFEIAFFGLSR